MTRTLRGLSCRLGRRSARAAEAEYGGIPIVRQRQEGREMRARNLSLGMSARAVLLAAGGVLGLTGVASGQTAWRDPVSGDLGTGTNWNNGVPTAISNASIVVPGGAFTVRLAGAATFNTRNLDVAMVQHSTRSPWTSTTNCSMFAGTTLRIRTLLLGQAATPQLNRLVVAGATTMTDATLQSTSVLTRGALTFAGVTMNDICDTDMDHRGAQLPGTHGAHPARPRRQPHQRRGVHVHDLQQPV